MQIPTFIIPILVIQLCLGIISIIDILKNKNTRIFTWEIWIFIVLLINFLGPILYFTIGREED